MQQLSIIDSTTTMSSREIAELTGKRHDNVLSDARKMLEDLGLRSTDFSGDLPDAYGRMQPAFKLPKRECLILVSGYSVELRARIIDRWQELEQAALSTPKQAPQALPGPKVFTDFFRVARLIGCDKNAAAISANQATTKLTGMNVLELLGHTHFIAEKQAILFTPTELGAQFLGGISARKVNMLLAEAGLQAKKGDHWQPLQSAEGFCRVLDTGKKHGYGTPVQQVKWFDGVVALLKEAESA
jgi:hypothetical protein